MKPNKYIHIPKYSKFGGRSISSLTMDPLPLNDLYLVEFSTDKYQSYEFWEKLRQHHLRPCTRLQINPDATYTMVRPRDEKKASIRPSLMSMAQSTEGAVDTILIPQSGQVEIWQHKKRGEGAETISHGSKDWGLVQIPSTLICGQWRQEGSKNGKVGYSLTEVWGTCYDTTIKDQPILEI